jgi:hypothetical protein
MKEHSERETPRATEGSGAVKRSGTEPYGVQIPAGPPHHGATSDRGRGPPIGNQSARKYREFEKPFDSLKIAYTIESKNGVLRFYRDLIHWTAEGQIPEGRAGALPHLLDG